MRTIVITFEQLPACALSCYGSFQNQTTCFDAIAAVGETFDHFYVHHIEQTLSDLLPKDSEKALKIISDQDDSSDPEFSLKYLPDLIHHSAQQLQKEMQNHSEPILWFHCGFDMLVEGDLQEAVNAWNHDVDLPTELGDLDLTTSQLQAQGLSPSQSSRVIVTALSLAKDRFLGEVWNAWTTTRQSGDQFIVSAVRGDQRLRVTTAEWITSLSEPVTHLPLLVVNTTSKRDDQFSRNASLRSCKDGLLAAINMDSAAPEQQEITYHSSSAKAVRTQEWLLMHRNSASEEQSEDECSLFRKPEDIWETMDVAKQYPGLIEDYLATGQLTS